MCLSIRVTDESNFEISHILKSVFPLVYVRKGRVNIFML